MNKRLIIIPFYGWALAVGVGVLWPIPHLIAPKLGVAFTAFVALGVGLFVLTAPRPGQTLSFLQFLLNSALLGLVAVAVAVMLLAFLCLFLRSHFACDHSYKIWGFGWISYGLFVFLVSMLYTFLKR